MKLFLGNFYRHLVIFSGHTAPLGLDFHCLFAVFWWQRSCERSFTKTVISLLSFRASFVQNFKNIFFNKISQQKRATYNRQTIIFFDAHLIKVFGLVNYKSLCMKTTSLCACNLQVFVHVIYKSLCLLTTSLCACNLQVFAHLIKVFGLVNYKSLGL